MKILFRRHMQMEKIVILICCSIYIIVMCIIGWIFNQRLLVEHRTLTNEMVEKQLETERNSWESYQVLATMIGNDGKVLKIFDKNISSEEILAVANKLEKYKRLIPNTYDIYLYGAVENRIFSTNGLNTEVSNEELAGDEFAEKLGDRHYNYHKNFLVYNNRKEVKAIAHVLYLSRTKQRFCVVLEDYQSFCDRYTHCEKTLDADIIVVDASGKVMVGSDKYSQDSDIRDTILFKNRYKEEYIARLDNEKMVINYIDDTEESGHTVIVMKPYSQIVSTNSWNGKWILFYLILGVLVIQIVVMESWIKLYVRKVQNKLKKKNVLDEGKLYLLEYLENPTRVIPQRVKKFCDNQFGAGKKVGFFIFRLDAYDEIKNKYSTEDVELYQFSTDNIVQEIFGQNTTILKLRKNESDFLYMYAMHENISIDSLVNNAKECQEYIHKYFNFYTSYFISDVAEQEKMSEKYLEAYHILEYEFIYGPDSILLPEVFCDEQVSGLEGVLKKCDHLAEMIEKNSEEKMTCLKDVVESMYSLNSTEVHEAMFKLIVIVVNALKKREKREGTEHIVLSEAIFKLSKAKNLIELQGNIENLIKQVDEMQKSSDKIKRYDKYVIRVQEIIAQKYSQPDCYLESIAAELGITGKYLGKIYKKATGDTVLHALQDKRLEEAEKLLVEGNMRIREIAMAVGYTEENYEYFSVLFRKKYGKSPSDYRIRAKIKV